MNKKVFSFDFIKEKAISLFFLISGIEGWIVLALLLRPSEEGNQIIGGVSLQRALFVAFVFLLSLALVFVAIWVQKKTFRNQQIYGWLVENYSSLFLFFLITTIGFLILSFLLPSYRFGRYFGYFEQLAPGFWWLSVVSLQFWALLLWIVYPKHKKEDRERLFSKPVLIVLGGFIFLWIFIAMTGLGVIPDDRYWNEVGIPLLNSQIFLSLVIAFVFVAVLNKLPQLEIKKSDFVVFLLLWFVAAFFWAREPLPRNFFAVGPYPPVNQYFPYADSMVFDLGGQLALIGEGIWGGRFIDRALLSGLLAIFHLLVGQNYENVILLQTLLFSSLPAVLFLIGCRISGRLLGLSLGALFIFKGINAIESSTIILSVHPKYFLTEFAAAVFLALFIFGLLGWYQSESAYSPLALAGAALGVGVMLRTHLMIFFALVVLLVLLKYSKQWKKSLLVFLLFVGAFLTTLSPWMWRSQKVGGDAFFFLSSLRGVMEHRYSDLDTGLGIKELVKNDDAVLSSRLPVRALKVQYEQLLLEETIDDYPYSHNFVLITANHFMHNMITSFFMLPTTPIFHDLNRTIWVYPFWGKLDGRWDDGRLSMASKIGVLANLFLLSVGFQTLWKKHGISTLIPLLVFLFYHAANAIARTSGGRYLVPVDWILVLYYLAGVWQLIIFLFSLSGKDFESNSDIQQHVTNSAFSPGKNILTIAPFFILILSITLIDQVTPKRYPTLSAIEIVENYLVDKTLLSNEALSDFANQPQAQVLLGRGLYPRFYRKGQGEPLPIYPVYLGKDYPRLALSVIGDAGQIDVILPVEESPDGFPNAADLVVLGCEYPETEYLVAEAIIVLDEGNNNRIVYSKDANLSCSQRE